jgi:hypothetical protein
MLIAIGAIACSLTFAADKDVRHRVQAAGMERVPFPQNGVLHLQHATGDVTVEVCDCQEVEVAMVKHAKVIADLDKIHITTQSHGDEVLVTTDFPRHTAFPPSSPLGPARRFDLEYRITAPRNARLTIEHDVGEVHIDDIRGDIRATSLQGAIILHLPENGQYSIDAKSDYGAVNSDFAGRQKRSPWVFGVRFVQETSGASQKLYLRIGYGDIVILKTQIPALPGK